MDSPLTAKTDLPDVSRETSERLVAYEQLIRKWNPAINLVARSTLPELWQRHFLDSIKVFDFADVVSGHWVDIGSGGGFPGAVVAVLAAERAPELSVTCIESDIRKCEFLRTVARQTGIKLGVLSRRSEETPPQNADVLSARALSGLTKLLEHAERHLGPTGIAIFQKGEKWQEEVDDARKTWTFELETLASQTQPGSALLKLRNIARA